MRPELACSTSGIILTGTETKYKQSFLEIQNTTKFVAKTRYKQSLLQKQNTNKVCGKIQNTNIVCCKNKVQKKLVANPKYRNSGCKTGLGGASYNVHRKMRRYLGEASSPSLFKMSQVLKNKIG